MSYSDKLKDPRWQKKRLEILQRDFWSCQQCMSREKTLHVHHLDYLPGAEPWEYENRYLITLCENCHTEVAKLMPPLEKEMISELRLALKDPLLFEFAIRAIREYDDDLLYLLYECRKRKDEVMAFLIKIFNEDCQKALDKVAELKQC